MEDDFKAVGLAYNMTDLIMVVKDWTGRESCFQRPRNIQTISKKSAVLKSVAEDRFKSEKVLVVKIKQKEDSFAQMMNDKAGIWYTDEKIG